MTTAAAHFRPGPYVTLVASIAVAVLMPIEFEPGWELIQPDLLFLLGVSCAGLALGHWARDQRTV